MTNGGERIGRALRDLLAEASPTQDFLAAQLGIHTTDAEALQHLARSDHPTGTVELARLLRIRSASAAVLVDRLETAGHVTRTPHPSDGRRVALRVTDSAQQEVRTVLAPLVHDLAALTGDLTADQQETVLRFLDGAAAVLRRYRSTPPAGSDGSRH
ncbi:MarR family winged helix-turn-helix transcriptional regulator [Amycolatopsis sp. NPDC051903]|uniref:MarR family winged helix-turn-helix transcriptional regulator n=1 Tax=Amycolatopsis sp. NPDC051903 TaxID=3363936 RepID=UPI0037B88F20